MSKGILEAISAIKLELSGKNLMQQYRQCGNRETRQLDLSGLKQQWGLLLPHNLTKTKWNKSNDSMCRLGLAAVDIRSRKPKCVCSRRDSRGIVWRPRVRIRGWKSDHDLYIIGGLTVYILMILPHIPNRLKLSIYFATTEITMAAAFDCSFWLLQL